MTATMEEYHERMEWIYAELGGKCVTCGSTKDRQVHHLRDKSFDVSKGWAFSKKRLREELRKCELQCKVHHKKIHTRPHGTEARYGHSKCRCVLCKEAHRVRMNEYRAKRKLRDPRYRRVKKFI